MHKLTWKDIRLSGLVVTPDGDGWLVAADIKQKEIKVQIRNSNEVKAYKLEDISLKFGQNPSGLTEEIGDIAIIFSRIEDRVLDFLHYVFSLRNTKQKILLLKNNSFSTNLDMINTILKDIYPPNDANLIKWNGIYAKLRELTTKRNNIIHGSMYVLKENVVFANSKKINKIEINEDNQVFSRDKLVKTAEELYAVYYENMNFLNDICENVKINLNKSDKDIFDI